MTVVCACEVFAQQEEENLSEVHYRMMKSLEKPQLSSSGVGGMSVSMENGDPFPLASIFGIFEKNCLCY